MAENSLFRAWFYFRNGWSMYFAFIFAAINTLTVTYFLAIERAPALHTIFPTFFQYVLIVSLIGAPLLIGIGYAHWKRTKARKAEVDIGFETNPYQRRIVVNTEAILQLNLGLIEMLMRSTSGEKLTENEIKKIQEYKDDIKNHIEQRTFKNQMDYQFFKKIDKT
jgi:hypothetical protein|tara:strand:+ start:310 stop:804 length:495 start_codon:yes stop_codon:yes gene_type:complete